MKKAHIIKLGEHFMAEEIHEDGHAYFISGGYKNKKWKTYNGALKYLKDRGYEVV